MTAEEATTVTAKITELETKIAACEQEAREANVAAAKFNQVNREARMNATALREAVKPYRDALAVHVAAENKRLKDEAAAKMQAEAEAKSKEPAPKSELELLKEQVLALTKAIEAKG